VEFARRAFRDLSHSAWTLLAAFLVVLAGAELTLAVADSRTGRFIALGAVALTVSLTTSYVAVRRLRGKSVRGGPATGAILTIVALLLVLLLVAGSFLRGPS